MNLDQPRILRQTNDSVVVLDSTGLVRKIVTAPQRSSYRKLDPEEMIERELRALKMLKGLPGVQQLVRRFDSRSFYSEFVPGTPLSEYQGVVPHYYFNQVRVLMDKIKARGVLRIGNSSRDFLIQDGFRPAIVDFGNVLFQDDFLARVPGIKAYYGLSLALRMCKLERRYTRTR